MSTSGPLSGLRVLDLSRVLAGPYAGRLLADLGAEVIKLEPPEGDVTRNWGKIVAGLSGYYTQWNVGKQNVCVDLRKEGAPDLVRKLAGRADVVIENFRPGVLAQYGLAYADLARDNPGLVMLSISGYGQNGPESQRAAYASVVHAESGIVQRQAAIDKLPPVDLHISLADTNAGLHGVIGLLALLYERNRTGLGQHVDVAMLDAMLATDDQVHITLDQGPLRDANVNEIWDTGCGPVVIAGDFRWVFRQLMERCGLVDPTPEGAPLARKIEMRRGAVREFLLGLTDRAKLFELLDRAELAFGEVRSTAAALESPTARARGSVVDVDDRAGGTRRVIQSPYRFSRSTSGVRGPAPMRGEHNREILQRWLELSDAELDDLSARGVLLRES